MNVHCMYVYLSILVCICTQLDITGAAIWINPFIGVLTIISLWPVGIMFMHIRNTLRSIKLIPKYAMYQVSVCTDCSVTMTRTSSLVFVFFKVYLEGILCINVVVTLSVGS